MTQKSSGIILISAIAIILGSIAPLGAHASLTTRFRTDVLEIEKLLSNLGYWILKVDGVADASTKHAITAFQKVEGRKRTGILSAADREALLFARAPESRFQTGAAHVEIDLTRQVLFLTDSSGTIVRILPVSSGNDQRYFDQGKWQVAHTPRGHFRIERKIKRRSQSPFGKPVLSKLFLRRRCSSWKQFGPTLSRQSRLRSNSAFRRSRIQRKGARRDGGFCL